MPNEKKESASVLDSKTPKETPKKSGKKRSRFNKKLLIPIIAGGALIIGGIIALILLLNSGSKTVSIFETDAFFLPNNGKSDIKYALFKNDGEQLTGFDYTHTSDFINGYAAVRNADKKYGVIDHTGKMTVEYDTYKDIISHTGFYEATAEDGQKIVILGDGKELVSEYEELVYDGGTPYLIAKKGGRYTLYNVLGDTLTEFDSNEKPTLDSYSQESLGYVSYDKHLILLNNKTLKVVADKDLSKAYEIDTASKNLETAVLVEKTESSDKAYAIYYKEEIKEFGDSCEDIDLYEESRSGRNYLSCKKDNKSYLIRNGEVTDIVADTYGNIYRVYDENHYIKYDADNKKVTFFVDGEAKTTLKVDYAPYVSLKGYYIRSYNDKNVTLYDIDGNKVYTLGGSSYSDLSGLDKNDNIIVRDTTQKSNERYYLVNKAGDTISEKYSSIYQNGAYYSASKSADDKKRADLLNDKGELIISGEYASYEFYKNESVILGRVSSGKYDLIDVKEKSVKQSFDGSATYYRAGYIRSMNNEKVSYYTVDGKLIYEYDRK